MPRVTASKISKKMIKSALVASIVFVVYIIIGLGLIYWPVNLPFKALEQPSESIYPHSQVLNDDDSFRISARDGKKIYVSKVGDEAQDVIVFLHGIASTHQTVLKTANELHQATGAQVLIPDLRGHGASEGESFDLSYIGQYEDDLEDMVLFLKEKSNSANGECYSRIIIGGHSMGGGIALRYGSKEDKPEVDAYLLFAPNFGEGPTQRTAIDPVNEGEDTFIHFNTKRMIGQLMMTTVGITSLNSLPILYFNFPPYLKAYSFTSVMSAQPTRPLTSDIALERIKKPLFVVIGENDEVFLASAYPEFVDNHSELGSVKLIQEADHMGILSSKAAIMKATNWLKAL